MIKASSFDGAFYFIVQCKSAKKLSVIVHRKAAKKLAYEVRLLILWRTVTQTVQISTARNEHLKISKITSKAIFI